MYTHESSKAALGVTLCGALTLCGAMACSSLDPGDQTCRDLPNDCVAIGGNGDGLMDDPDSGEDPPPPPPGPWDCLDAASVPLVAPDPAVPGFGFILPVVDFANPPTPPAGLTILVCQINDYECDNPVPVPPVVKPDPMRPYINLINLPYGFDGYLRLNAPGYIQNEYYLLGPILGDPDGGPTILADAIGMPRNDTIANFFVQFGGGVQQDMSKGLIAMRTFDCDELARKRAAGVRLELRTNDPGALGFTILNGQPATNNPPFATDSRGVAGFVNVLPVVTALEGVLEDGRRYGSAAVTVRANQLTQADLRPNYLYGR